MDNSRQCRHLPLTNSTSSSYTIIYRLKQVLVMAEPSQNWTVLGASTSFLVRGTTIMNGKMENTLRTRCCLDWCLSFTWYKRDAAIFSRPFPYTFLRPRHLNVFRHTAEILCNVVVQGRPSKSTGFKGRRAACNNKK